LRKRKPPVVGHSSTKSGDVAKALQRAERMLARPSAFTPLRRQILSMLVEAGRPVGAYDLIALFDIKYGKHVAPSQIYRVLDFLRAAGLVHRLATQGAYIACDHEHAVGEVVVFLVCGQCGSVAEAPSAAVEKGVETAAASMGFRAAQPIVEVDGECASCGGRR
jgi:Fur family zinc uptake transcriptional regulator